MRDILQQYGLAGTRRRNNQRALSFADWCDDVDNMRRSILLGLILVFHFESLIGVERCQVVEIDLGTRLLRIFEIDRIDLEQGEIALSFFRRANMSLDVVAGTQAETANLAWRNIDVVRSGKIV